jgi:fumarate reductase flavoprotein subunit
MKKRSICFLLTAAMILSMLAGCGTKTDETVTADTTSAATETADTTSAATETVDSTSAATEEAANDLTCDIVIVGAGGAGLTSALQAVDNGAESVIIVEKTMFVGGNSVRSTGGMNAAKTEYQDLNDFAENSGVEKTLASAASTYADNAEITELAAIVQAQYDEYLANPTGYFDSVELFELDTMIGGYGLNDLSLVKKLAENSADAIDWLETQGAVLHNVSSFGGASVKRIHRPVNDEGKVVSVGSYLVPILQANCEANQSIQIIMETAATEIIMNDGKAAGIVVNDGEYSIYADAVILACGGFGANNEMVATYQPSFDGYITTNAAGITGDGIVMATAVGADTVDMDQIQLHPTVYLETASLITEGLRGDGAILVNQNGERFCDEVGTRDKVSAAEFAQPGGYAYLIVDQKMVDASSVIAGYITKGMTVEGATLEELAANLDMDADTLTATMETWNASVEAHEDAAFGRTSFANPLDTAPYYAIKVGPAIHHTMGGVKINDNAEVIDTNGDVIPGLFAAGEVTGGVHGGNRLGGNAVADFVVFGRIAGASAQEYAK